MTEGHHLRQKPPTAEDEYFAREDRKRIEKLREERHKHEHETSAAKLREEHWMCCPKCGNALEELEHFGLLVDRCTKCHGVWLDAGELDALATKCKSGLSDTLFGWLRS